MKRIKVLIVSTIEVDAEHIASPKGYEEFNFFIHPSFHNPCVSTITEESSGMAMVKGLDKQDCIKQLEYLCNEKTPQKLHKRINVLKNAARNV